MSKREKKIGILAGTGDLAQQVILALERENQPFFILAFEGQTDPAFLKNRPHQWVNVAKIGKSLEILHQENVKTLVLVGHFKRPAWSELRLDLTGAKWMAQMAGKALGDDGVLKIIVHNLEKEGFEVLSPEALLNPQEVLMPWGVVSERKPDSEVLKDIERGLEILKALPDVGQSIILQQGLVLGVEAIEGTDALMERCADYHRPGPGGILIKVLKPGQEGRVDRPTIGPETLKNAARFKLQGVAVQAGEVLVLDQKRCLELAKAHDLFFLGFRTSGALLP